MRMRRVRHFGNEPATFHLISRVVAGEKLLGRQDQEVLRKQTWKMANFCGVRVLTYCILSNHFHLLVRVPPRKEIADAELVRRYAVLYGEADAEVLKENLSKSSRRDSIRKGLLKRMNDISFFMKELKMRFTIYYNHRHNRFGTLWAERFKSLLVENDDAAVRMVAAYIDLNPVRAGLCTDPKEYRFCGYAEAVAGGDLARMGLAWVNGRKNWREAARHYRTILFGVGVISDRSKEGGIDGETSRKVLEAGGRLPLAELVRCRFRYFSDGVALGSGRFLNRLRREHPAFEKRREQERTPEVPATDAGHLAFARRKRRMQL